MKAGPFAHKGRGLKASNAGGNGGGGTNGNGRGNGGGGVVGAGGCKQNPYLCGNKNRKLLVEQEEDAVAKVLRGLDSELI